MESCKLQDALRQARGIEMKELHVTMFGDFVMEYGGVPLKLERTNTTKAMQALQLLLYYGDAGVLRDTLLDFLYSEDSATEPANNLKVTISNLRRLLLRAGLPEGTTIQFRGGSYYWDCPAAAQLDIRAFEKAAALSHKGDDKTQTEHLLQACALYTGDFLPHLQSENWAVAAGARYREQYFACVRRLTLLLEQSGGYDVLLPVVTRAAGMYGLEEFQLAWIDCLMHMQRYTEAKQVYEDAVRSLRDDYDLGPSKALLERCRQLDEMANERTDSLQDYQETLSEDDPGRGAYYCTYPGFIDAYRVVSRMLERNGQSAYLLMCWLTDTHGREITDHDKLMAAVPKASAAIRLALRRGDLYTQPSRDRFLILLVGTSQENCSIVTARIQDTYKLNPARGISLSFRLSPVGNALEQDLFAGGPQWK